jgi:hypothetical protein
MRREIQQRTLRDLLIWAKITPLKSTTMRILKSQPITFPQLEDPIKERRITLIEILKRRKGNKPRST